MIFVLPILFSLMSTAAIEAFSSSSNINNNNNNNFNSQLTRRAQAQRPLPSLLPQQVRRSCSSSALSAHHGFSTNHDSLVYTSSLVRSSSVPTLNSRTHSNNNGNINGRRSSSSNSVTATFLSPMDLVSFASAISAKFHAKQGAAGLMQKMAGKAVVSSAGAASAATATAAAAVVVADTAAATVVVADTAATAVVVADTAAAASTATTSAAIITTAATAVTATNTAAVTTSVSESAHQMVVATATAIMSPDKQAEVLSDSSFALCEYPTFLPDMKTSKLLIRLAQVLGRILIIDISLLPGHTFHPEELAIQLFLLGASMQPIIRSLKLLRSIKAVQCNNDGCTIDFDDLDADDDLGDIATNGVVVNGDGNGRLECTFGTGGEVNDGEGDHSSGLSVQCNSDGCTIDFDDLDTDDLGDVTDGAVADSDGSGILECTFTGDDGGLECTVTDTDIDIGIHTNNHDHDHNLVTSFDDNNVVSRAIRVAD